MFGIIVVIVGLAIAYCFITTPKYEIIAQFRPGITGFDEKGNPVRDLSAKDIQTWFEKESYLETLVTLLGDEESLPELKAGTSRNASLITVSFYWPDADQGKQLLQSLIDVLGTRSSMVSSRRITVSQSAMKQAIHKTEQDVKHITIERKRYDDEIVRAKNESNVIKAELKSIKKNIAQAQQTIKRLKEQIDIINNNTQKLMQLRQEMAKGASDKFALLMYSNIIQQNIVYVTNLEQRISDREKEINSYQVQEVKKSESLKNTKIKIKDLEVKRDNELPMDEAKLQKELSTLKTRLSVILSVDMFQPPFSSIKPVKPAKIKIVAIAVALSCFMAVLAAFLREFWVKNRERVTASLPAKRELSE